MIRLMTQEEIKKFIESQGGRYTIPTNDMIEEGLAERKMFYVGAKYDDGETENVEWLLVADYSVNGPLITAHARSACVGSPPGKITFLVETNNIYGFD